MKTKQYFYIMILLIVVSLLGIAGSFYWGINQLEKEASTISDLQADRDVTQETIVRLQKAKQDSKEVDSVNEILDRLLPTKKDQAKLIADIIYTASAEAGIPFNQVSSFVFQGSGLPDDLSGTEVSKDYPGVFEYPFSMNIESITYEQLIKYLQEIEKNGRIIQVGEIIINPESGDKLGINLSMKAYIKQ